MWVAVLRDAGKRPILEAALAGAAPTLSRFTQLELLAGCHDERQWDLLDRYLAAQDYVELDAESWPGAARLYFDLRRRARGGAGADLVDCCVAQLAIDREALLLHCDPAFDAIAKARTLRHRRLRL